MYFNSLKLLLLVFITSLGAACSSSESFTGFSYDPEGAAKTTDKSITPQHKRTIGIAEDGVWISNEFAGARLSDFFKVNDSLYQLIIKPENTPINNSPWYAFKIWADTARKVNIKLAYENGEHRYVPDVSANGKKWSPIDSTAYRADTLSGTATLSLSLQKDTLWVSGQELITQSEFDNWSNSLIQKPFVQQQTIGYSHQQRTIKRLTISEINKNKTHGVLIITSRLHPPEVTGQLAAFHFLDVLASDSELAQKFRKQFEVIAYPFANPDGVQNGHWRHNAAGVDLNRDWIAFNQPETKAIRDDLLESISGDSLKTVFYGIDFHSTDENIFYPINRDIQTFPDDFSYRWLDALAAQNPDIDYTIEPFDTSSPITKNWIYRSFGADALTYEVNDTMDRERIKQTSRKAAELLMQMLLEEMQKYRK